VPITEHASQLHVTIHYHSESLNKQTICAPEWNEAGVGTEIEFPEPRLAFLACPSTRFTK